MKHILLRPDNKKDIEKLINISETSLAKINLSNHILQNTDLNLFHSFSCEGGFADDESMMKKDLRFKPKINLEEGLEKFVNWYKEYHKIN